MEILVSSRVINVFKKLLLTYEFVETCKKKFRRPRTNFFFMECCPAPDLSQTRTLRLVGLDIARPGGKQKVFFSSFRNNFMKLCDYSPAQFSRL